VTDTDIEALTALDRDKAARTGPNPISSLAGRVPPGWAGTNL